MRNYIKNERDITNLKVVEIIGTFLILVLSFICRRRIMCLSVLCLLTVLVVTGICYHNSCVMPAGEFDTIQFESASSAVSGKKTIITIPAGIVKENPFVPYRNLENSLPVADVPSVNLIEPPEVIDENSDAARVMDTIVSGILYDKYSPSAILNIEGSDYLVKKGDVVSNYKVVNIMKDSVTVKLGANVYKAGIGEILTEGSLNRNDVSNLNNKFGGVRKWVTVVI